MVTSVYEVADHYKFAGWDSTTLCKEVLNVVELTVDVACKVDGSIYADDVGLFCEYCFDLVAEAADG